MGRVTKKDYEKERQEAQRAYIIKSEDDFLCFARGLTIPSATGPQLFELCSEDFQMECFEDMAPSIHAVRDGKMPSCRRFWIERTKKSSKDSDLAVVVLWLMAFARRPFKVQVCAANRRQAGIIENRAVELVHYNQWLEKRIEIVQGIIRNKAAPRKVWAHIEATDSSGGAHGETPDLLILNELVHVAKWKAMEDHMQNADGVPQGVVVVCTNAGIRGTKAWTWRKTALDSSRWRTHIWSKKAPWISQEDVDDARARDPVGAEFKRLWEGTWISGAGDALDEDEIDRTFCHQKPLRKPRIGWRYLAGLDLGVSHDHAGVALVGIHQEEQRIRVVFVKGWEPSKPNDKGALEVDGEAVEESCLDLFKRFGIEWFGYDPAAGGSFMAQRLRKRGIPMREMTFSQKNCTEMAVALVQSVKDRKLECYEDEEGRLRRDFGKFSIVHKPPSSYKLDAVSDEFGHADVGTALIIALPEAMRRIGFDVRALQQDDVVATPEEDDLPLDEKEVKSMPPELRDIYEDESRMEREHRISQRPAISDLGDW